MFRFLFSSQNLQIADDNNDNFWYCTQTIRLWTPGGGRGTPTCYRPKFTLHPSAMVRFQSGLHLANCILHFDDATNGANYRQRMLPVEAFRLSRDGIDLRAFHPDRQRISPPVLPILLRSTQDPSGAILGRYSGNLMKSNGERNSGQDIQYRCSNREACGCGYSVLVSPCTR